MSVVERMDTELSFLNGKIQQQGTRSSDIRPSTTRLEARGSVLPEAISSLACGGVFHFSTGQVQPRTAVGEPRCDRAPAHSMRAKNRRVYAGDFGKRRPTIRNDESVC
jgi:hypothetical protein